MAFEGHEIAHLPRTGQGRAQPDRVRRDHGLDRRDVDQGLCGDQPGAAGIDQRQHGREHVRGFAVHGRVGAVKIDDIRVAVYEGADAVFAAAHRRKGHQPHRGAPTVPAASNSISIGVFRLSIGFSYGAIMV